MLVEWNDTHVVYDLEKCVHQLFEAQASQTPDAVAMVVGNVRLSYREVDSRAEKLARRLRREGIGPEQRVGVLVGRGAAVAVAVLEVLKAGGAYVRWTQRIQRSGCRSWPSVPPARLFWLTMPYTYPLSRPQTK